MSFAPATVGILNILSGREFARGPALVKAVAMVNSRPVCFLTRGLYDFPRGALCLSFVDDREPVTTRSAGHLHRPGGKYAAGGNQTRRRHPWPFPRTDRGCGRIPGRRFQLPRGLARAGG